MASVPKDAWALIWAYDGAVNLVSLYDTRQGCENEKKRMIEDRGFKGTFVIQNSFIRNEMDKVIHETY